MRCSRLSFVIIVLSTFVLLPHAVAAAQESTPAAPTECGVYEGVTCQGWFTDDAGVVEDDQRIEDAIDRVVGRYGHQIAVVIVSDSRGQSPADFAAALGNAWGVGDPERNDGIVVLVSLEERRTEVVTGPGVSLPESVVASAGDSYFAVGDFDFGVSAIVGSIQASLEADLGGVPTDPTDPVDTGGVDEPGGGLIDVGDPRPTGVPWTVPVGIIGVMALAGGGVAFAASSRKRAEETRRRREELIDGDLAALEPAGHELPQIVDYRVPLDATRAVPVVSAGEALAVLGALSRGLAPRATDPLIALVAADHAVIVDRDRLFSDTEVPLELRASGERSILEEAVQAAASAALEVEVGEPEQFSIRRQDVQNVIESLRPHRIAAARRRTAEAIATDLVPTEIGYATLTDAGHRLLTAGPALTPDATLGDAIAELGSAYETARTKTAQLERFYDKLPESTTRPAVAAALADLDDDADAAFELYEKLRHQLEEEGDILKADGLDIPALAALLLMNNDGDVVAEFVDNYRALRRSRWEPGEAVEYAMAGLRKPAEIERVRSASEKLGLPVSIAAALLNRRDDGVEVYRELLDQLAAHEVTGDTRRTIAGILAISLEPTHAVRRWVAAREALDALGLSGSYADVAAAFGASDPRGPKAFALAYAAQRQALARSSIEDADRFAPELAHQGTRRQTDTWTGQAIPPYLGSYDPFTLLFYHWIITRGHHGSYGWEPIYRDASWSGDRNSWWGGTGGFSGWGGGGGFGGGIGGGGGSSWGGGGGFGGFGGFGGGGGFSGGGGGGGSGW